MRRALTGAVVVLAVGLGLPMAAAPAAAPPAGAATHIVVLDDSVANPGAVAAEHARRHGATVTNVYSAAIKGYAAIFRGNGAGDVAGDGRVRHVEPNQAVSMAVTQLNPPSWGLDRIDEVTRPLDEQYTYSGTGAGVTAYVIDTGIRTTHSDFLSGGTSRAEVGHDTVGDGRNGQDCNGHGTHVAGTVGGNTYGVAKAVRLVAVRVLNCAGSGTTAGVIAGLDWVTAHHATGDAVANMSLGGGASTALDNAVRNSIADGITYAVAAGNGNAGGKAQDACRFSPARVAQAITVGATDSSDRKASWSNYGTCVDLFAPGVGITSAWSTSDTATNKISGTSMATPHTAGVAALYLQANPGTSPAVLRDALYNLATPGLVTSSKTANARLLFMSGL